MTNPKADQPSRNFASQMGADSAVPAEAAGNTQRAAVGYCRAVRVCTQPARFGTAVRSLGLCVAWLSVGGSPQALGADIVDWRPLPTQAELDALTAHPINDPLFPYIDYRPGALGANLDLPGLEILKAMSSSADKFGSWAPGHPGHTDPGYILMSQCLKTTKGPTHWSDLTLHYYCQLGVPRKCYTFALAGTPAVPGLSRTAAYQGCQSGKLPDSQDFSWVASEQPLVFQYVMFGQTAAFNPVQEQAIINAFYGVESPSDAAESTAKRPLRTEDPTDGTHCLADKVMSPALAGKYR